MLKRRASAASPWLTTMAIGLLLGACAQAPPRGPSVLPSVDRLYEFGSSQVHRHAIAEGAIKSSEPLASAPPGIGSPGATAVDPLGGYGVAAFETGFACLGLVSESVFWKTGAWPRAPARICVAGDLLAALDNQGDGRVALFRLPEGQRVTRDDQEDLRRWRRDCGLERFDFVVPVSAQEFVVVGSRKMGFLTASETVALRFDLSKSGADRVLAELRLRDMTILAECSFDGRHLVLAGIHEDARPVPGPGRQPSQLLRALYVVRIDPKALTLQTLVRERLEDELQEIRQVAVDNDLVVVGFADGECCAYRASADGRAHRVFREWLGPRQALVCLSPKSFAAIPPEGGAPKVIAVP